jgi:hypothetical protein
MSPCVVQGDLNLLSLGYSFTFCACLFAYFLLECSLVQSVSPSRVAAAAPPPLRVEWGGGVLPHRFVPPGVGVRDPPGRKGEEGEQGGGAGGAIGRERIS